MKRTWNRIVPLAAALACGAAADHAARAEEPAAVAAVQAEAARWRAEQRIIDMHQHVGYSPAHLARAVRMLDRVGVGVAVDLDGGTVTPGEDGVSAFERNKKLADELFPGRFVHYMHLDYQGFGEPDFGARAARQIDEGRRLGAAGLKEFKRLGLGLRDAGGQLIRIDDPRLDPVWARCGELGMPVSIHVADPKAFWDPYDERNERWKELKDHPGWWFGDPAKHPPRMELLEALNRVVGRHPGTLFVCVHFANNAEDIEWVGRALDKYPNMLADLAARIPELGRHDPEQVRRLFEKHQDRILFGTDFMVYDRLILGSSGNEPPPTDDDAATFFAKEWRWLETRDRDWEHMTPIQGDWTISSIGLPAPVLRKVYFDNARKLLARALPLPVARAARTGDFDLDGTLRNPAWAAASRPLWLDCQARDHAARPELATAARILWSERFLYLGFECPFTELTTFDPPRSDGEREGLWERDVVEAFIAPDPGQIGRYTEYEVAPTNERLDLRLSPEGGELAWDSGFQSAVHVDRAAGVWRCEMRIPLGALSATPPTAGTRWRLNLFRHDAANRAGLAWSPPLSGSFHVPERFGTLEFAG